MPLPPDGLSPESSAKGLLSEVADILNDVKLASGEPALDF